MPVLNTWFNEANAIHSVLRHLAERRKIYMEDLYEYIGWPLYCEYGHAYDAFKLALADKSAPGTVDNPFVKLEHGVILLHSQSRSVWLLGWRTPHHVLSVMTLK
eukprot:8568040-Ditylum_brightwellii.AAC.1